MGWLIVRDALSIGPWHHEEERSQSHRRSPTDYDADHVLLRLIECVEGSVEINLECEPAFDYGGLSADWSYTGPGYHEADGWVRGSGFANCAWSQTCGSASKDPGLERGPCCMRATQRSWRSVGHIIRSRMITKGRRVHSGGTAKHWQEWLKHGTFPDHPWRSHLQRSALTLKGLTFRPTGAMIAAATASLPETPGGDRNWDYRYSWIRDSTFMLWALYTLGFDEEANDFFYFVADVAEAEEGQLQIMYGIGGEGKLEEQELDHLSGLRRCHARSGSATGPTARASMTCGARSWTRSTCTPVAATSCRTGCGR